MISLALAKKVRSGEWWGGNYGNIAVVLKIRIRNREQRCCEEAENYRDVGMLGAQSAAKAESAAACVTGERADRILCPFAVRQESYAGFL